VSSWEQCSLDFVDINMGCQIDSVCKHGCGAALTLKEGKMKKVVQAASTVLPHQKFPTGGGVNHLLSELIRGSAFCAFCGPEPGSIAGGKIKGTAPLK
jgi:hypothetical protein